jgi:hypothetical protein
VKISEGGSFALPVYRLWAFCNSHVSGSERFVVPTAFFGRAVSKALLECKVLPLCHSCIGHACNPIHLGCALVKLVTSFAHRFQLFDGHVLLSPPTSLSLSVAMINSDEASHRCVIQMCNDFSLFAQESDSSIHVPTSFCVDCQSSMVSRKSPSERKTRFALVKHNFQPPSTSSLVSPTFRKTEERADPALGKKSF